MMKLTLCAALVWMIFSSAEALQCVDYILENSTVSSPCRSPAEQCATVAISILAGGDRFNQTVRMCVPPSFCAAQDQIFSATYDVFTRAASIRCCNTDNCNNDTLTFPDIEPNGLSCFTCYQNFCNTLKCVGTQDRCFHGTAQPPDKPLQA
ncbi:uncharacterized protein LOC121512769 isoform X2 [Cheilinus undulatus]|uniref:uncharacterized protein LOC121512769 isoform X2 n=1 Tax=Cheilinus undulatus TaxID=241271 RepID=UPI001BD3EA70|nr:uncharacterized protein LOC121512769 isoform X2 [Cheilinus undulatus]